MKQTIEQRLRRIIEIGDLLIHVIEEDSITQESILTDFHTQWLITTPLYNIGEQVYALPAEYKQAHPGIPWSAIAGMRHRLVHDYDGTNWSIIAEAVLTELPTFIAQVRELVP